MRRMAANLLFLLFAGLIMALSICGPEMLTRYRDRTMLGEIHAMTADTEGEGYRYTLSAAEKLHILSESLDSQAEYETLEGAYAFVMNHRGPSGQEITDSQIYETCNPGLEELKKLGILPESVRPVGPDAYDAVLYSAIDVLEPRNNVAVWKLSLVSSQKHTDKENRLMDAYIDGDNGKIYEFYARTPRLWDEMDPDQIVDTWSSYMGLGKPSAYGDQNPLMEATPYFKKYVFSEGEEEETIVTVGFYEGINELFLKISR
ncbi:MAG: hypothetical protein LUK37_08610 [Clostridia bacterium]|nr:hypothetical protein [Clostridia bacterium]